MAEETQTWSRRPPESKSLLSAPTPLIFHLQVARAFGVLLLLNRAAKLLIIIIIIAAGLLLLAAHSPGYPPLLRDLRLLLLTQSARLLLLARAVMSILLPSTKTSKTLACRPTPRRTHLPTVPSSSS